ncbi:Dehydrogenase reductase SDR member 1 [Parelaphostrongylus tenuis]|uniref:Dehydrogenase reductase SDR member 1 n=1 Tax=Parelaphostrongylus tenuis TaxID=148309 RepID=A0AAD5QR09_PARTN|nr:Dehydrogenase reductase SDR member 1 [Parelaphostrongylus tenuis]
MVAQRSRKMAMDQLDRAFKQSESTEFVGKAVVALAADAKVQKKSGKVLMTYDLANEYGFKDIDGSLPGIFVASQQLLNSSDSVELPPSFPPSSEFLCGACILPRINSLIGYGRFHITVICGFF